jgi:hypothetical protein
MLGWGTLHFSFYAFKSFQKKIFQIPPHTVDSKEAEIMDVEIAARMSVSDFRGIYTVQPVFCGDIRGNVIVESLEGIAHITVFLDFPIQLLDIMLDKVNVGFGRYASDLSMLFPV